MRHLKFLVPSLLGILFVAGCSGDGEVQSPDFTPRVLALTIDNTPSTVPSNQVAAGRSLELFTSGVFSTPPGSENNSSRGRVSPSYSVEDSSIARIEDDRLVGVQVGATNVVASMGGILSDPVPFVVTPAVLESIVVTPAEVSVPSGRSITFTAMGVYSDNDTPRDIDEDVTWRSSAPAEVDVLEAGTVSDDEMTTATTPSPAPPADQLPITATVTARATNSESTLVSGTASVSVVAPTFESVTSISPQNPFLPVGRPLQFTGFGTRTDGTSGAVPPGSLTFTSSDPSVATIDENGIATGVRGGRESTTITVTLNSDGQQVASTTLTGIAAALDRLVICSDSDLDVTTPVVCDSDPDNPISFDAREALGTQITVTAFGIYSDAPDTPRSIEATVSCPLDAPLAPVAPTITWVSDVPTDLFSNGGMGQTESITGLPGTSTITVSADGNETCTETPAPGITDVNFSLDIGIPMP